MDASMSSDAASKHPVGTETSARSPAVSYVFRIDPEGVQSFTYVSQACSEVYGFTAQQAVVDVRLMHDAIHPSDRGRFDYAAEESVTTLAQMTWEGRILRTDGRERSVLITSRPQRLSDGAVEWHGVVADRGVDTGDTIREASPAATYERDDLLGILGHEIGAPLAAILGYADWGIEVLQRDRHVVRADTVDTILLRCFEVIARQGQRLNLLRDDLLATANADNGMIRPQPQSVDVAQHLRLAAELRLRDLTVHIECPEELTCFVQPSHLDQVLANLVANAERFASSQMWLRAAAFGDRVRVSVADDGPGVAPQMIERLFTRFSHAGGELSSKAGTGLGLYIVRALVVANGGTVVYEPQRRGARFTFSLPPGKQP